MLGRAISSFNSMFIKIVLTLTSFAACCSDSVGCFVAADSDSVGGFAVGSDFVVGSFAVVGSGWTWAEWNISGYIRNGCRKVTR